MSGWLAGKRALVIGAGSGIGRAVVEAFLNEGAQVAALERDPNKSESLTQEFPSVLMTVGDATSWEVNKAAIAKSVEAFGGIDTLISCVGVFDYYQGISETSPEKLEDGFTEIFDINVKSLLLSVKAALPALNQARGSIIFTASTSSYFPGRGGVLYVASKFAVRGLVTALGHELAPYIRVNGVAPGGTTGTDLRGLTSLGLEEKSLGGQPGREADLANRVPLKVALSPKDHAGSFVFLASDRARGITGDVIHSDGGISVKS